MPSLLARAVTVEMADELAKSPKLPLIEPQGAPSPDPTPMFGFSPVGNPSPYRGFPPITESLDADVAIGSPLAARMRRTISNTDSYALDQVSIIDAHAFSTSRSASMRSIPIGTPKNVLNLKLNEVAYVSSTGTFAKVTVSFSRDFSDPFWGAANVYVGNYQGAVAPIYITTIQSSPSSFTLLKTGELVTVTLVSVSTTGVTRDFSISPSTVVRLS